MVSLELKAIIEADKRCGAAEGKPLIFRGDFKISGGVLLSEDNTQSIKRNSDTEFVIKWIVNLPENCTRSCGTSCC